MSLLAEGILSWECSTMRPSLSKRSHPRTRTAPRFWEHALTATWQPRNSVSVQNGPLGSPAPETGFKPPFDCFARVESGLLQDLADISTGEDQNRMTVLNNLGVCLVVNARGGYENSKLPVAQPGDESCLSFTPELLPCSGFSSLPSEKCERTSA
jgi:hypothetical protein